MQVMMDHREIFVRPDKYGGLTIQLWWSLYGLIVPTLLLPVTYLLIVVTAFNRNWLKSADLPADFYRLPDRNDSRVHGYHAGVAEPADVDLVPDRQ
jgi:hypothetical protein